MEKVKTDAEAKLYAARKEAEDIWPMKTAETALYVYPLTKKKGYTKKHTVTYFLTRTSIYQKIPYS